MSAMSDILRWGDWAFGHFLRDERLAGGKSMQGGDFSRVDWRRTSDGIGWLATALDEFGEPWPLPVPQDMWAYWGRSLLAESRGVVRAMH